MNIAFYAPLKPPTSAIPSGDRQMGRALITALEMLGHHVELASDFESREPTGDLNRQKAISLKCKKIADKLINSYELDIQKPDLWFTYHLYYKAPDWIGPLVAKELRIPYVVVEASHAPKRAGGPWDFNHQYVEKSIKEADLVIGLNSLDALCVRPLLSSNEKYLQLRPFIDLPARNGSEKTDVRSDFAKNYNLNMSDTWFLTVAMMRKGAKFKSYEVLAKSLHSINKSGWQLIIAGDGPLRLNVEGLFDGLPVTFVGQQDRHFIFRLMEASDIFLWPAIEEAYGIAILEAQSFGLPVIAGNSGGVGDIIRDKVTGKLTKMGDVTDFSNAIDQSLSTLETWSKMGLEARETISREHSMVVAARQLDKVLSGLING